MSSFFIGRPLGDFLDGRRDNMQLLRFLAAVSVVFGHCGLGGGSQIPYDFVHWLLPNTYVHVVGVIVFFTLSGFLVTHSYERSDSLVRFLRSRALRLWPALAVCTVVVAFVLGPLVTPWPLTKYFSLDHPYGPYRHALGGLSVFGAIWRLDGLFDANPVSKLANGPLWTIPVEATLYLWVAGAGALRLLRLRWITSFAIAAFFFAVLLWPMMNGPLHTLNTQLSVQGFFGFGVIACLLRRHIPISTGIMLVVALAAVAARHTIHAIPFTWLAIGYFAFWFSYVPRLPAMPKNVDLSYGTYLWGWPVQQTLVHVAHVSDPLALFALTLLIVLPIALASWVWVEKPALRFKTRLRSPRERTDQTVPSTPFA